MPVPVWASLEENCCFDQNDCGSVLFAPQRSEGQGLEIMCELVLRAFKGLKRERAIRLGAQKAA